MSVLNKIVSYFPSKNVTTQGVEMNLLTILQSHKHKKRILNLRASPAEPQKQLKENLPCYTVAGTFNRRCDGGIIQLSGLAAVDLDSAEDYNIPYLLKELKKIPSIAYAGLSCRGTRLFCIVPFLYPDKYAEHYERLIQSFKDYGLPMGDECHKSLSQPRFVSWNDSSTQFFNHEAVPYHLLTLKKTYSISERKQVHEAARFTVAADAFQWCVAQLNRSHSFTRGQRHSYIIQLARYCNMKGIQIEDTLNGCRTYEQSNFVKTEIDKIVHHIYTTQKDTHNSLSPII